MPRDLSTEDKHLLSRLSHPCRSAVNFVLALDELNPAVLAKYYELAGLQPRQVSAPPMTAAEAIIRVANARMAGAIRLVSIERGYDPGQFVAMPLGQGYTAMSCVWWLFKLS